MPITVPAPAFSPRAGLLIAALLLVGEVAAIGLIFKHGIAFECLANWPAAACSGASGILIALYCMLGAVLLFGMLKPDRLRELTAHAGARIWPLGLNLAGTAIALLPVFLLHEGSGTAALVPSFILWGIGMALLLAGLGLFLASPARWLNLLQKTGFSLGAVLLAGALAPEFATQIRPLWRLEVVADLTFSAVSWCVRLLGYEIEANPVEKQIWSDDFGISVAPVCSGVEGIALVTIFVTLYLILFRKELRFPQVLLLYPLGIAASALFNVVRISVLLVIGLEGNPALAVGGFHSHAGWLMFTLVALGIIALAQTVPALKRTPETEARLRPAAGATPLSFWRDPVVARILPFAVFMLGALTVSTVSQTPGALYPGRVLVLGAVLLAFLPVYRRLPWRIDPIALAGGAAIGLMWCLISVEPADAPPYGTLSGGLLVVWFVFRGLGTVLLVPLVEELFFRDYLERRLRMGNGRLWAILAACVTATLFAALHDRWAEAFVAGLVFSALARRRDNIADAILAHATANAIVYAAAVATGNLSMI